MKKMILGASALVLSSSAFAGAVHANSVADPLTPMTTAYGSAAPWAISPALQSAVVEAGMNHADPATTDWMGDQTAAFAGDKNVRLTAAQMGEKQAWLAEAPSGAMGGKNTALTAEQMSEKQTWLAQNGDGWNAVAMGSGKGGAMNGQGGPYEASAGSDGMDLPACRPGPGDDRCIQLYERGMSRAYAQWSAGRAQLGMGGPEEPLTGKDEMASTTSDMSMPAAKAASGMGPTTEPTGVTAQGKTAMTSAVVEGTSDMAAVDAALEDDGMTAEQMQTGSARGAKANGS